MSKRNRNKRMIIIEVEENDDNGNIVIKKEYIPTISIDAPISKDESITIADIILDEKNTIEKKVFENNEEGYSKKMLEYLDRLSTLQKNILRLIIAGYLPKEIVEELHITQKQYSDSCAAIHSYRNVCVLF
jgi:DNA-directed RNA polymerase sigma subunit (sigma70/sigma32)